MSRHFQVRIGKVIPKAGGAPVVLLKAGPDFGAKVVRADLARAVDAIFGPSWADLRGVALAWWGMDGSWNAMMAYTKADNPIPPSLVPSYVKDLLIRRQAEKDAGELFDKRMAK